MKLATFFRKTKEQKAIKLANRLVSVLQDLELRIPPEVPCGYVSIWIHSNSRRIEYNNKEINLNPNKTK